MDDLALASRFMVGFILVLASIPKLASPDDFRRAVHNYRLLSPTGANGAAWLIPRFELGCGLALILGLALPFVGIAVASSFLVFALAIAVNLIRQRYVACGCLGAFGTQRIRWWLVFRDVALAGASVLVAIKAPTSLSVPGPSRLGATVTAPSDAVAVLVISALIVVAELLVMETIRLREANNDIQLRLKLHQLLGGKR